MLYHISEGSFQVPDAAQDRSVNMLVLNHGPGGLTLVVTRDALQAGEDLDDFLARQLRTLALQVKGFRQQEANPLRVGATGLPAARVATTFRQNNASLHQLQTALLLGGGQVLVLTLSCASPLTPEQAAYGQLLLDSFVPASRAA